MTMPEAPHHGDLFPNGNVVLFHDEYRKQNEGVGPPRVRWLGTECLKCPLDLWIYQEIITSYRPDVVIEGGTASGGSALYMATVMDAIGHGQIVTMDWDADDTRPKHDRITYLTGDTLNLGMNKALREWMEDMPSRPQRKVMILDDGHSCDHVEKELALHTPLLNPGDWLIVEDTNLGGPYWGLKAYLEAHPEEQWERQTQCERLLLTFNPWGYWRKVK